MPLIAETPRLLIETWTLEDIPALVKLSFDEGLSEFSITGYANFSVEQASQWIRREIARYNDYKLGRFKIVSKELKVPIGISGLFPMLPPNESQIELNYRYPTVHRGKGYATEAARAILNYGLNELKIPRINANIDLRNAPSHAVIARLGMKRIGETIYEGIRASRWSITSDDLAQTNHDPKPSSPSSAR